MRKRKAASKGDNLEDIAKVEFLPVKVDTSKIMSRTEFMANMDAVYTVLVVGTHLLTKDRDDLIGCMRHLGVDGAVGAMNEAARTKRWLDTLHEIATTVTARLMIATACTVTQEGA